MSPIRHQSIATVILILFLKCTHQSISDNNHKRDVSAVISDATKTPLRRCCTQNETLTVNENGSIACQEALIKVNPEDDLSTVIDQDLSQFHIINVPNKDVCLSSLDYRVFLNSHLSIDAQGNLTWSAGSNPIILAMDKYCASNIEGKLAVLACIQADKQAENWLLTGSGMLISMPFLAITFIVYALLPDKNLYQYALMIYVLTLFLAYLQLVLINYITLIENEACILIGYLTLFSFTTSFFWLNVICFDIWFTFSRGRSIVGGRRSSEIKKLGFYSIYAFGVPLVLIILVYLLQTEFLDPLSIHNPKIGKGKCFLETGWPSLWYLYLEAGLIIIANLVFFSWTAVSIRKVKKETAMLKHNDSKRHAYEKSQKKFNLFIKLAFAMGINWSTEIISWFVNWQTDSAYSKIWIVTDCVNALYGVFIFFIFVFKKKTWRLLKRRYYAFRGKVYLAHSMGGTSSRPTNISTTESTVTTTVNGARRPEDNILLHDRR
ncbi:G-protein coupled receptor Mth2-like isoform X2 [Anthonomus grandis grandis]|uniref:G-protein coupled receptor Mth2-like isoform X2 n=1 Tax=Anthonomus grandis grandis TaxID=2921223 RepID=UPI0021657585|nr:G-protein coupled receptor Mth2-like isoform X2 [Anthonomus grandis grandis]